MIIQDFNYALRLLSKKPSFTVLTILVMAAGIGLSLYLFSFFNTVLYKDLPFEGGDSIVLITGSQDGEKRTAALNVLDYEEIKKSVKGLSDFGAYYSKNVNVAGRDGARRYSATVTSTNLFQLSDTKVILGREFNSAEGVVGSERVVVISYELWQNQLGGNPEAIDQQLQIDGNSYRIIGVMPESYAFPHSTKLWLPLKHNISQLARSQAGAVRGIARLDEGASLANINQQLAVIMQRLEMQYPKTNSGVGAYVTTLQGSSAANGIAVVYSMQVVAALILILASINVGNLLLSRAVERGKETAIRVALGAPRSRLISQMLWESIIICSLGGLIGLLMVAWGLEITNSITDTFFSDSSPFWWKFGVDGYTIKLFIGIVFGTILITGFLPAWKSSGGDFNAVLRDGTRGALGKKAGRLNKVLVISEIFISISILISAAVMLFAAYQQSNEDIGANTDNILTARVSLTRADYGSDEKITQFAKTLKSQLKQGSGVDSVIIASALPGDSSRQSAIAIEGKEYLKNNKNSYSKVNNISIMPDSLAALGVELKQGRYFNFTDNSLDKKSVLVSDSFVKENFANELPLGKRIKLVDEDNADWLLIVGVVENTIHGRRSRSQLPTVFRPLTQAPYRELTIAIKMKAAQSIVIKTLRSTLQLIDPKLAAYKVETYTESNNRYTAPIVFISKLISLFGLAAAFLAASGIYGVMSNTINQRTQEIGIKRALGADEATITKELLMTGFKQLLWGGIPGILVGAGMGFAMSQTFGTANSALVLISLLITSFISSIVMYATYAPTQKALLLEPSEALHYE